MAGDINSPNCISSRCRALFKAGLNDHEFKITNIKPDAACVMLESNFLEQVQKACETQMEEPDVVLNMKDPSMWTLHEKAKNIAWFTWGKQGKIPEELTNKCNYMQKIVVTTEEDMRALDMSGVNSDIVIIDEPIDTSVFGQIKDKLDIANVTVEENGLPVDKKNKAILVQGRIGEDRSIIECLEVLCSKYKEGDITIVLRAYKDYMGMQDDLQVADIVNQVRGRVKSEGGPKVNIMTKLLADEELCMLYNSVDVVINTSRLSSLEQITLQPMLSNCSVITFKDSQSCRYENDLLYYQTTHIPVYDGRQCNDLWVKSPNQRSLKQTIDKALKKSEKFVCSDAIKKHCDPALVLSDILC